MTQINFLSNAMFESLPNLISQEMENFTTIKCIKVWFNYKT